VAGTSSWHAKNGGAMYLFSAVFARVGAGHDEWRRCCRWPAVWAAEKALQLGEEGAFVQAAAVLS
jgi:hypothetical protein